MARENGHKPLHYIDEIKLVAQPVGQVYVGHVETTSSPKRTCCVSIKGYNVFEVDSPSEWSKLEPGRKLALRKPSAPPRPAPLAAGGLIEDGFYQVLLAGRDFIFRIKTDEKTGVQSIAKAKRFGSRTFTTLGRIDNGTLVRNGVYWKDEEYQAAVVEAMTLLSAGEDAVREAAGKLYARSFGRCYVCNRPLTVPDSLATGIGPDCAGTRAHHELSA